jgi:hypothetical protein
MFGNAGDEVALAIVAPAGRGGRRDGLAESMLVHYLPGGGWRTKSALPCL